MWSECFQYLDKAMNHMMFMGFALLVVSKIFVGCGFVLLSINIVNSKYRNKGLQVIRGV